jgi:DNA primase
LSFLIPEEKISEVKHAADIVDIVSEVVLLKKTGHNFVGLCPFHSEKTPSFTVSPDKQIFHCFGCGEGGNVFRFLMKHQGLSFPEAVRAVAGRYGVDLPVYTDKRQKKAASERQRLLNANRQAFNFYRKQLADERRGRSARSYLEKRGIANATIETFGIGYAPPGWDNLLRHLTSRGISPTLAGLAGLAVPRKEATGSYDRFRNRIVIPIFSLGGEVIAFGGRVLDDEVPKYLNSPETPLFNKRSTLFNLQRARGKCRQTGEVIIVEGYFDLIAVAQAGIENVVATLGTALTPEHVRLLKGYAPRMVLVYDGDEAGLKAAVRSYDIFARQNIDARVAVLPDGHDPDSFVARFGAEAFRKLVAEAPGMFSFLLASAVSRHGLSIEGKIRVVGDMVPVLSEIGDRVARSLYVRELADRREVPERDILQKVRTAVKSPGNRPGRGRRDAQPGTGAGRRPSETSAVDDSGGTFRIERQIVAMMVQYPSIIPEVARRGVAERFLHDDLKRAAGFLLENAAVFAEEPGEAVERFEDEKLRRLLTSMAVGEELWNDKTCHIVLDQFESGWRRRRNDLQKQIESAEKNDDQELLLKLLKEQQARAEMKSVPF